MKGFIKELALKEGFALCGVCGAKPLTKETPHLREYLQNGNHAAMKWLEREPEKRVEPTSLLPSAKSVICCALSYGDMGIDKSHQVRKYTNVGVDPCVDPLKRADTKVRPYKKTTPPPSCQRQTSECVLDNNKIARFARGLDYHVVIKEKLKRMVDSMLERDPNVKAVICVDTSPIMEKPLAARARLGWIGKNTLLINKEFGPWLLLGEIITDLELEPDQDETAVDHCGDCKKCIEACPTNALLNNRAMDARRCVSYLTIEQNRRCQDSDQQPSRYGCDICLEACPYSGYDKKKEF